MGDITVRDFGSPNFERLANTAKTMDAALKNVAKVLGDPGRTLASSEGTLALREMQVLVSSAQLTLHEFRVKGTADPDRLKSISTLIQALPALVKGQLNLPLVKNLSATDTTNLVAKIKRMERIVSGLVTSRAGLATVYRVDDLMVHFFPRLASRRAETLQLHALMMEATHKANRRIEDLVQKIEEHGPVEPVGAKTVRDGLKESVAGLQRLQTSAGVSAGDLEECRSLLEEVNFLCSIPDYALGVQGGLIRMGNGIEELDNEGSTVSLELVKDLYTRLGRLSDESIQAVERGSPTSQKRYDVLYRKIESELAVIRQLVLIERQLSENEGISFPQRAVRLYGELQEQFVNGELTNERCAHDLGLLNQFFDHIHALDRLVPALGHFGIPQEILRSLEEAAQGPTQTTVAAENEKLQEVRHLAGLLLGCCRMEEKTEENLLRFPETYPELLAWIEEREALINEVAALEERWAGGDTAGVAQGLLQARRGLSALSRIISDRFTNSGVDVAGQREVRFSPFAKETDIDLEPDDLPLVEEQRVADPQAQERATEIAQLSHAITEERIQAIVEKATSQKNARRCLKELGGIVAELESAFSAGKHRDAFENIMEAELTMIAEAAKAIRDKYPRV